jgi:Na+-driven multidrug efflux pump
MVVVYTFNIAGMMDTPVFVWMPELASSVSIMTGKPAGAGEFEGIRFYARRVRRFFLVVGIFPGLFVVLISKSVILKSALGKTGQKPRFSFKSKVTI